MIDVKGYVENEINYLEKLTEKDIEKIQKLVEDDSELQNEIDNSIKEAINYHVYHYIEREMK